jgi:hypothetical protein
VHLLVLVQKKKRRPGPRQRSRLNPSGHSLGDGTCKPHPYKNSRRVHCSTTLHRAAWARELQAESASGAVRSVGFIGIKPPQRSLATSQPPALLPSHLSLTMRACRTALAASIVLITACIRVHGVAAQGTRSHSCACCACSFSRCWVDWMTLG